VIRRLAPLVLVLAVVAGAGCGESTEEKFEKDYKPLNDELLQLGQRISSAFAAVPRRDADENGKAFGALAQDIGEVQQDLDELEPPDDLSSALDDLVSALGDVQGGLEDLERQASGRLTRARVLREVGPAAREVNTAQDKLAKATGARVSGG
jgi:hypothetical protein